ncbi:hypothetical protein T08_14843 [Trichinella sp. T8]|nr:hypothetical protein T08_14843 [Trichinella sp. T8]
MIQKYWNSNRIKNFGNVKQHEEKILEKVLQRLVRHTVLVDLLKYCYDALFEILATLKRHADVVSWIMSLNGWNWMSRRSTIMTLDSVTR